MHSEKDNGNQAYDLGQMTVSQRVALLERLRTQRNDPVLGLERCDRTAPLLLSFSQQRLWFLIKLEARASTAYHIACGLKLSGELDRDALHMALDRIVARHEALRTRFVEVEGTPYQQIDEPAPFSLTVHDLRGRPAAADELRQLADEEAAEPFDLQQGPPIRGRLIRLSEREQVLLVTLHHIVADGWSLNRFMRELGELYRAFSQQQPDPLPPLAIQYADYAVWQRRRVTTTPIQSQLAYWREQLADTPPLLDLPIDRPRPAVQNYAGGYIDFTLDATLTTELKALAARHDSTLFMTLLTGWTLLLYRLSGQDDIVVGSPVAGRTRTELEPLIGFFANTLALRNRVDGAASVGALLAQVKETTLAAQAHQDLPFEQLVEALNPTRSLSHSPLFQTLLAWQNLPDDVLQLDGVQVEPFSAESVTAKFDLLVSLEETGASLSGSLDFAVSVFDRVTVARMLSHWQVLLRAMVSDETLPVAQLPLLTDDERHSLLHDRNHTEAEPVCVCLHQQFEAQARREPQAIALVFGEQRLSYDELNRRANQLAHALMAQGVGPESRVAISLPRGVEMVVAVLAVLKAGGGYVPIDPTYPAERIRYLLEDSAPLGWITEGALWAQTPTDVRLFDLEAHALLAGQPEGNPDQAADPHQLAYVIYTSGSTGQPKGVMVEHAQVMRLFASTRRWFDFGADDVWSLFHSLSFDFSVWELWGALLHGGRL
ncbi:condensation domain-containing protein, partial [Lonsdalea quercina]|uniref:condensation domain-containing protein n=1 Tax=Lonsdalea quercina TaxID=71657 RepID=UPI00047D5D7C